MKTLKKVLLALAVLIVLLIVGIFIFFNTLKPDYKGTKSLANLQNEVKVYYDNYGIPHIYADDESDALRALGYVHAQDRLWQMELLRRVAKGRIAEVFGADFVKTDKFFLSLGIADQSVVTVSNLRQNDPMMEMAQAYLDGINEFIAQGPTPIEFYLTGIEKEPFTLEDVY
ncbi:MAG: penicillin acylase family protein, partial [Allomuricauda sp.]